MIRRGRVDALLGAVTVAVALAVYSSAIPNGFVMDDHQHVVANRWIRDPSYLREVFTSTVWYPSGAETNFYRPLVQVIWMALFANDRRRTGPGQSGGGPRVRVPQRYGANQR